MKPLCNVPDLKFEPDWRRLKFVIEQSGLSEERFAEFVGLDDADIITHIRYAQCGIDAGLARRIHDAYPQFPTDWLLGKPDSGLPSTADMFYQVGMVQRMNLLIFERAEEEFETMTSMIAKSLIEMIVLDESSRRERFDALAAAIRQMMNLLDAMQQSVQPSTRERLRVANEACDDLCQAAETFGLPL